jgi:hypothetical protein
MAAFVLTHHKYCADLDILVAGCDAQEKRVFDAIDGVASIAEITADVGSSFDARSFFRKLWCYDQVVFHRR